MPATDPKRQKLARETLRDLFARADDVHVIHYSCESFYDQPENLSPRVACIALRNLDTAQTKTFSVVRVAEEEGVATDEIDERYRELERTVLHRFFSYIGGIQTSRYIHWNMRDEHYGFYALEHRYRVLCGASVAFHSIADQRKFDMPRLLIDIYGPNYVEHPRMIKLLEKNGIEPRDFLTGEQEAAAFEREDYVALHRSTLRKVDVISDLAAKAHDGELRTNSTWWDMHGGRVWSVLRWIAEHKSLTLIGTLLTLVGLLFMIVQTCR